MVEVLLLLLITMAVASIGSAMFRRDWWVAIPLSILASLVVSVLGLAVGRVWGHPFWAVSSVVVATVLAVLVSPRKGLSRDSSSSVDQRLMKGAKLGGQLQEIESDPVEVDEIAFQQWLEAHDLLGSELTPERLLDLRRQFAGLA